MKIKTGINDVVLVYFEENPLIFARIEDITPDQKPDWYHVKLLLLKLPLETVTWILRDIYIDGEGFTMNGNKMRLERVLAPKDKKPVELLPMEDEKPEQGAKVLSFKRKKKTFSDEEYE